MFLKMALQSHTCQSLPKTISFFGNILLAGGTEDEKEFYIPTSKSRAPYVFSKFCLKPVLFSYLVYFSLAITLYIVKRGQLIFSKLCPDISFVRYTSSLVTFSSFQIIVGKSTKHRYLSFQLPLTVFSPSYRPLHHFPASACYWVPKPM